jgi:hypothetical protein
MQSGATKIYHEWNLLLQPKPITTLLSNGAVKLMRTRIRLLAQPKSMRSIIDATRRE